MVDELLKVKIKKQIIMIWKPYSPQSFNLKNDLYLLSHLT